MVLSECGGTGVLFIAHIMGFACLSLSEVSLDYITMQYSLLSLNVVSTYYTITSVRKLFRGKGSLHCFFGVEQNKELWNSINAG